MTYITIQYQSLIISAKKKLSIHPQKMKQAKLITGLNNLLKNITQYQFQYSQLTYQCTIKQLYQQQLQNKYPQITLQNIVQQYSQYLFLPAQLLGKRSSQIMISTSKKYCCKLIDQDTLQKIIDIIHDIWQYQNINKQSYLIDIYRIFVVESIKDNFRQSDTFIIMPCLRPNFQDSIAIYDIKGHTQARNLDHKDFKIFKFGKDQNFIISKQLQLIQNIDKQIRQKFIEVLIKDINFLENKNIIDYSLLLSFRINKFNQNQQNKNKNENENHNNNNNNKNNNNNNKKSKNCIDIGNNIVMQWYIIDYLQQYNQKKKAQNMFKSLFRKQVSSVQPTIYGNRFINFIKKYFML